VRAEFGYSRRQGQRLADLKGKTTEFERELADARMSLERELAQPSWSRQPAPGQSQEDRGWAPDGVADEDDDAGMWVPRAVPDPAYGHGRARDGGYPRSADDRTEVLISHGRHSAHQRALSRRSKVAVATAVAAVLVTIGVTMLLSERASWPASVATVQRQADEACQNPDVRSEPGQVNFACAKATRQILWVFALMTSGGDAGFADAKTGRVGLEPISPAQGGAVAWSLNLHHPYDPSNPIDSLQVAARAINNIIGGATVTGADGDPVVQPGLESHPANCRRYTGSGAVTSRKGFPGLCARPVAGPAGQAALVADVYRKWVVGAAPRTARDAAVLFENAENPGDPQVQAILQRLSHSSRLA
jgi:hypothetical protein